MYSKRSQERIAANEETTASRADDIVMTPPPFDDTAQSSGSVIWLTSGSIVNCIGPTGLMVMNRKAVRAVQVVVE